MDERTQSANATRIASWTNLITCEHRKWYGLIVSELLQARCFTFER